MRFSLTLAQKGFILVLIPLAFQLVFVGTLIQMLHQAEREIAEANHARIVVETTEELASRILIFFKLMHEFNPGEVNESIRKFLDGIMRTREDLVKLKTLVAGHHREEVLVARAQTVMDSALDIFENVNREVKRGHTQKAFDLVGRAGGQIVDNLKELINILQEMLEQERAVERAAPARQAAARHNIEETVAVFLGLNCVLALLLAFIFNHNTASRLGILTDNVGRLARNEPLNAPLSGDDEIARIDRAFNEMSESLTAARQKEVAIVENASDAIVSIDIEACFEQVNPAAVKLLGYTAAKLSGASFIDLVFAEDRQKVEQHIDRLHNGEKMPPLEIRLVHRDGTAVDVLWSANWSQSDQALYCVMHNISERKQIDQMKQEFVAMVSHDLRTPLTSVQTCLALVETGNFGEINADGLRFIAMADSNITRLIGLVNGLLDIERMTSGKLDLHFAATTLNEIVQSSIDSVAAYAGQQDIELVADVINADVIADRDRLVQVVVNLISNAIKFSPKSSQIVIGANESDRGFVEFRVSDKGRGIPEELRKAIFDRFKQVERDDATKRGGAGLGLSICKGIVEAHGGRIGVDSIVGMGSTFWFKVPLMPVPAAVPVD